MIKVLLIGYGSIGRRHFEVLSNLTNCIDVVTSQSLSNITTFKDLQSVKDLSNYDYFVICSPTNKHKEQLIYLDSHTSGKLIFCEKPLFDIYSYLELPNNAIFVGFVLRYHPIFKLLKANFDLSQAYFVEISCGSYLPTWRSNIDYKDCYSAKRELGGGVALDLSHEIDYTQWLFGEIVEFRGVNSKISELEISSDDLLTFIATSTSGVIINLNVNYFSKIPHRLIRIHATSYTIEIDLIKGQIVRDDGQILNASIERNEMFLNMHKGVLESANLLDSNKLESKSVANSAKCIESKNAPCLLPTFTQSLYTSKLLTEMRNMKLSQKILCIIGCRGGSKGVKNKNIRPLCGKPLLAHTILQALHSRLFSNIVLSTDSSEIASVGQKWGAEVFFLRDKELATDSSGKLPAIRDALLRSEAHFNTRYDVVIDLDATSPLREVSDITGAYEQFVRDDNDILITAAPARKSPYFNLIEIFESNETKKVDLSKKPQKPILRRQDSPKCYDMNASIYIWKRDALLENDSVFVPSTGLFVMPEERSVDIDTELDFEFVEFMMNKRQVGLDTSHSLSMTEDSTSLSMTEGSASHVEQSETSNSTYRGGGINNTPLKVNPKISYNPTNNNSFFKAYLTNNLYLSASLDSKLGLESSASLDLNLRLDSALQNFGQDSKSIQNFSFLANALRITDSIYLQKEVA